MGAREFLIFPAFLDIVESLKTMLSICTKPRVRKVASVVVALGSNQSAYCHGSVGRLAAKAGTLRSTHCNQRLEVVFCFTLGFRR